MPAADAVLLPLCIGLSLVAVVFTVIAFARHRPGRAVQGLALALAPVALYFTGLLRLVWDAVVAIVRWATGNAFDLTAWIGFGLLALCVVLWVVGGVVARRSRRRTKAVAAENKAQGRVGAGQPDRQPAGRTAAKGPAKQQAAPQDDDMAEIEALLKSRGIQ
jgi:succinate-acetate transporter protein